ncbi:3',5'-cyclic AMP phosphodiesterase CpdA [Arthrobacter sp. CAN_A6]|uniref:phosphodiesterase n=1 Tax=Arthrobacter sp. CAN_A6 TaxID=2787721 RepID=UPI0018CB5A83
MSPSELRADAHISAEHPPHQHLLLHLSDTHFVGRPEPLYGAVDSEARLKQLLGDIQASGIRPDALIFTGDLTDKGEPEAYRKLRDAVEPVARELGAPLIWLMGNHDRRENLRECLLDEAPEAAPLYRSYRIGGLRILTLDTSVPGHHYGELDEDQLVWLTAELATAAPEGTILAMHHPPIPMIQNLAVLTELRNQDRLRGVIEGSDVRLILGGHLHFSSSSMFAGIPVSVASATCYTQDLHVPDGGVRGRDGGQGHNLVHVYPDSIVNSVAPLGSFRTVGRHLSAEEVEERVRDAGRSGAKT